VKTAGNTTEREERPLEINFVNEKEADNSES